MAASSAAIPVTVVKYSKIWSCDYDLRRMTLKFNRVLAVAEIHAHAKFHRTKCRVHDLSW